MPLVELVARRQALRRQHRARRRLARGRAGRDHRHHRPLRLGQEHHAALHQRARADPGRPHRCSTASTVNDPQTDLRALRQHVGIVFQSFNLFPHLSVEKNITLAPQRREAACRTARRGRSRRDGAAQGRARGEDRRLSRPALGRPAAARRDRPLARHAAAADAVRRDHLGARSRAGRRGAEGARGDGRARA